MKSPFTGMDPYLEMYWRDVHHRLCTYACDALQPQVRPALFARIDERLVVESDYAAERSIYPDVKIAEKDWTELVYPNADAAVGVAEPGLMIGMESEPATEGFITIVEPKEGNRLVTVIEFLSPTNKVGTGREVYRRKQAELRESGVSLVEIDLVRAGEWTVQVPRAEVPPTHQTPWRVCVRRHTNRESFTYYRAAYGQRLPVIDVPLRYNDPDAKLDLQVLIDQVYVNGAYDSIDYTQPCEPPIEEGARAWVNDQLRKAGKLGP